MAPDSCGVGAQSTSPAETTLTTTPYRPKPAPATLTARHGMANALHALRWAAAGGGGHIQTTSDFAVYAALVGHVNREGWCWPSMATLAAETHMSRRNVQRTITRLVEANQLGKVRTTRGNRYRLFDTDLAMGHGVPTDDDR